MPKPAPYSLSWDEAQAAYILSETGKHARRLTIDPGSNEWFRWLEGIVSFGFLGRQGRLTARREKRDGNRGYWYGYRRFGERVHKEYLGLTSDLTTARLEAGARKLTAVSHVLTVMDGELLGLIQHLEQRPYEIAFQGSQMDVMETCKQAADRLSQAAEVFYQSHPYLGIGRALLLITLGQLAEARACLEKFARPRHLLAALAAGQAAYRAWLPLLQGDLESAVAWVEGSGLGTQVELTYASERSLLIFVRVLLAQKEGGDACSERSAGAPSDKCHEPGAYRQPARNPGASNAYNCPLLRL